MNLWRPSKELKDPDECQVKKCQDCSCNVYCKLSLHCEKHETTDQECVDCAWDFARSFSSQVEDLHNMIVRHAVEAGKANAELIKHGIKHELNTNND